MLGPAMDCGDAASAALGAKRALATCGLSFRAEHGSDLESGFDDSGRKLAELYVDSDEQGPCWVVLTCMAAMDAEKWLEAQGLGH